MSEETTQTTPPADPMAAIHAKLDAQDKTNEAIMVALAKLTAGAAAPSSSGSESASGSFRAPPPKAPIAVVEKSPEDLFMDKMIDRLQARLGLAVTGGQAPVAEPGGPCNLCDATGFNAGGVVSCNRCQGTGVMPGRRLS